MLVKKGFWKSLICRFKDCTGMLHTKRGTEIRCPFSFNICLLGFIILLACSCLYTIILFPVVDC